jgi:ribosomal protein S4E
MSENEIRSSDGHNVRISPRAWELLRYAKLEKDSKSYSELIIEMDSKIGGSRIKLLNHDMDNFEKSLHQVSSKDSKGSKTVLLSNEARKILETIKVQSNEPAFTFSDAIEFLVKNNKIKLPEHLQRLDT